VYRRCINTWRYIYQRQWLISTNSGFERHHNLANFCESKHKSTLTPPGATGCTKLVACDMLFLFFLCNCPIIFYKPSSTVAIQVVLSVTFAGTHEMVSYRSQSRRIETAEFASNQTSMYARQARLVSETDNMRLVPPMGECLKYKFHNCESRSQSLRGLRHEMSSPARTLGSWVRIPFKAWMCLCLFCVSIR
jgi:hypothetical protein